MAAERHYEKFCSYSSAACRVAVAIAVLVAVILQKKDGINKNENNNTKKRTQLIYSQ